MRRGTANIRDGAKLKKMATKATAKRCAREVMEAVPLVMRYIRREIRRQGTPFLSVPQLRTLVFLSFYPGSTLVSVADHLGVTPPTASAIVNRLVRRGLVNRTGHPRERRCIVLTLTRAGAQRLRYVREATCSVVADVLADRSVGELRKIAQGVTVLGNVFNEVIGRDGR